MPFFVHFFPFPSEKGKKKMENLAIKLNKIEHSFGAKKLFSIESLSAYQGERIGIIGSNGQGKSTLLKLIAGELKPDSGTIQKEIAFHSFRQISDIEEENDQTNELDWELLGRFSVPQNALNTFSGGELTKYRLARVLSTYEMGLLLDEPTTHLDQNGIEQLIEELRYYYGTLLFVSHDRYFLNQLATKLWVIEDEEIKEYTGNYEEYQQQKKLEKLENERAVELFLKEKQRLTMAINQKKEQAEKNKKISTKKKQQSIRPDRLSSSKQKDTVQKNLQKTAKAMESRLLQLKEVATIEETRSIQFPISKTVEIHNKFPIRGEDFYLTKGEKRLFEGCDFQFGLGKRIAIIGKNGSGKSSLLKSILANDTGIVLSPKVVFSTYQQMSYNLQGNQSILAYLLEKSEYKEALVRSILHNLGFSQIEMSKPINKLSGGEATRVQIALLFTRPSNVLLLDEPTNFIDLQTTEALETLVTSYPGTVIFISHDRYFIQKVADEIYEIKDFRLQRID